MTPPNGSEHGQSSIPTGTRWESRCKARLKSDSIPISIPTLDPSSQSAPKSSHRNRTGCAPTLDSHRPPQRAATDAVRWSATCIHLLADVTDLLP
jgi:hypothetical protein